MMKISKCKKELARIISEHGGWRYGEFAAQDGDGGVGGYGEKPAWSSLGKYWRNEAFGEWFLVNKIKNHHQTVLSRAEYFHLYPDVDHSDEQEAEIRWVLGKNIYATPTAHDCMKMLKEKWHYAKCECDECSAFYCKPNTPTEPSIEQLAADYRNAKGYAERKQQEADAAKADADSKLKALEIAGEALGLLVSPIAAKQEPELATVQVGDEVECVESNIKRDKYNGMVGRLRTIDESDTSTPYLVDFGGAEEIWCHEVKFIRRP